MAGRKKTETVEAEVVETAVVPAGKMEFRLINPTEDGFLRRIQWNKEELEAAVRAKIAGYENVVYTEENIKAAKNDRAELNKLIKAIEERRKQVKNIINEPYAVFEAELKEITALINEPVALIDQQVKAFEEKQKEEKKAAIKATYDENIGDLAEVLPFEKIFDSRYLNQTYKLATAQKEIVDKIDTVKTDLETIDSLDSKYKLNAKDVYIKTLDLSKALAENKRLADLEEKLEADKRRKAEEEAERKRQEEIRKQKEAEEQAKREAEEEERKAAEAKKAQKAGISLAVDIRGAVLSDLNDTEMTVLFGNLLENAYEAAGNQGFIELRVDVNEHSGMTVIEEKNSYLGEIKKDKAGKLITSKNKEEHGIGMQSIEKIVRRHEGVYIYDFDKNTHIFRSKIALPDRKC